ncbi:hypothetical protein I0C86_42650 [Plantactinospora sp. S1510]|uniref:Uncharacterized protein n=1 Tax=Plantactinospora alkalitolerans TaxID=2789879 RepID=A0ABS0HAP6_9ACTN|nr:hypothetical protein [Plantactinospora alkalitolerans]
MLAEAVDSLDRAWVQYQGQEIMLIRSSDALRFGQIYRAVQRAIEQHSPEG